MRINILKVKMIVLVGIKISMGKVLKPLLNPMEFQGTLRNFAEGLRYPMDPLGRFGPLGKMNKPYGITRNHKKNKGMRSNSKRNKHGKY